MKKKWDDYEMDLYDDFDNEIVNQISKESMKAKGIPNRIFKRNYRHINYVNCLVNQEQQKINYNILQSKNFQIFTVNTSKISLSCYDDKRRICSNGIDTLAYGHCKRADAGAWRGESESIHTQLCSASREKEDEQ